MNEIVGSVGDSGKGTNQTPSVDQKIIDHLSEICKNSRTTFFALIIACAYSYLTISTTSDAALLTNSGATPLPIIQVKVPIVWFYIFAPIILTGLFFYFHFYLEQFWRAIVRLPLFHRETRRGIDDYLYPWLISSTFIRGGNPKLGGNRLLLRIEYTFSLLLAWWSIPILLLFYWLRYLPVHEWKGTLLHSVLLVLTVAFAFHFYYLAKNAVISIQDNPEGRDSEPPDEEAVLRHKPAQIAIGSTSSFILAGALFYFSLCAFYGLPDNHSRYNSMNTNSPLRFLNPGITILSWTGIEPFADISEKKLIAKPENWQALLDEVDVLRSYLETQNNLKLTQRNLRHLNAQRAFFPASELKDISFDYADLQHAVLTFSTLVGVVFLESNLRHTDFQYAAISNTKFDHVVADVARFNHVRFSPAKDGGKTTFSGEYYDAWFEHSEGDSLVFEDANLVRAHFNSAKINHSIFRNVKMAGATLEGAEFIDTKFYQTDFSDVQMQGTDMSFAVFEDCIFVLTNIKNAFFEDAEVNNSRFDTSKKESFVSDSGSNPHPIEARRQSFENLYAFGLKLKNVQINHTHFINADLRSASFEDVVFFNVRFSHSDLSGATFDDTDFSGVEFEDVEVNGADLSAVKGFNDHHMQHICGNNETKLPRGYMRIAPCIIDNAYEN